MNQDSQTLDVNVAKPQRLISLDYMRVFACFQVMLVHAAENFYGADSSGLAGNVSRLANEQNRFWVAFYDGGIARYCVPLFILMSAFLLAPMKPGQTMTEFYKRRAKRILPPMFIFMVLYCLLPLAWGGMTWEQSVADLKLIAWNFPSMGGHLWFMYPLISLYLIIPVVSPWLEKCSKRDELIFLGIWGVSLFLPWIVRFITPEVWGVCFWNSYSMLWYCSGYLGYLVMAHFIHYRLSWTKKQRLRRGWLFLIVGSVFTAWSFWVKGIPGQLIDTPMLEWSWEFCTPNVALATLGAFLVFTSIDYSKCRINKAITSISKLTFGMYLMHMFFLSNIAAWIVNGDQANPLIPVWIAIPAIAILSYLCCLVTTWLISLLPGSKWVVGA